MKNNSRAFAHLLGTDGRAEKDEDCKVSFGEADMIQQQSQQFLTLFESRWLVDTLEDC